MKKPIINEEENVIKKTRKLRRTITALSKLQVNENQALTQETTSLIEEADILLAELYKDFAKYQENLDAIKVFVIRKSKSY